MRIAILNVVYTECSNYDYNDVSLFVLVIILNDVRLSVITKSVIKLSVIMPIVIMLSVVRPNVIKLSAVRSSGIMLSVVWLNVKALPRWLQSH